MHQNLATSLDRADEHLAELEREYDKALREKSVTARSLQLTHDVCERLRSVLDRVARRYWEIQIAPALSEADCKAASIYFPITSDQNGLDSVLGRWRWKSVRTDHQPIYDYLLALQPFSSPRMQWLAVLNDLAVQGKHIDLVPQTRTETRRTVVTGAGGSVSWGPGVTFGGGVSIMGAPINPLTQRIVPTPGVTERIEIWVGFAVDGHGVDAMAFAKQACSETRRIVGEMSDRFGL